MNKKEILVRLRGSDRANFEEQKKRLEKEYQKKTVYRGKLSDSCAIRLLLNEHKNLSGK